jgi:hypothetical protein
VHAAWAVVEKDLAVDCKTIEAAALRALLVHHVRSGRGETRLIELNAERPRIHASMPIFVANGGVL